MRSVLWEELEAVSSWPSGGNTATAANTNAVAVVAANDNNYFYNCCYYKLPYLLTRNYILWNVVSAPWPHFTHYYSLSFFAYNIEWKVKQYIIVFFARRMDGVCYVMMETVSILLGRLIGIVRHYNDAMNLVRASWIVLTRYLEEYWTDFHQTYSIVLHFGLSDEFFIF